MLSTQRVLLTSGTAQSDVSQALNDFRSGVAILPMLTATDYLYVGSDLPFNHRFFEIETANAEDAAISVEIWFGGAWVAAVDVIDGTSESVTTTTGVPPNEVTTTKVCSLHKSGIVQWSPEKHKGWDCAEFSDQVTGISKSGIYDKYWVRFKLSANISATTSISFIGHKFSSDSELVSVYPDLANSSLLTSFETGKTSWDEQHFTAAELIVEELQNRRAIVSGSQILDWSVFTMASCHKVAEIVYRGLGRAYDENRALAMKAFDAAMNKKLLRIDSDADGRLNPNESRTISTGWLCR